MEVVLYRPSRNSPSAPPKSAPVKTRAKQMLSRLELLPAELLHEILEYLAAPVGSGSEAITSSQHTYSALCLTSKALYRAATPYLYRHCGFHDSFKSPQVQLLKNVCAYPELANHIRSIEMRAHPLRVDVNPGHLDILRRHLKTNVGVEELRKWIITALDYGCPAAGMFVLLTAATQLRHLDFRASKQRCGSRLNGCLCNYAFSTLRALFADATNQAGCAKLQQLTLRDLGREYAGHAGFEDILALLQLPALQNFESRSLCCLVPFAPGFNFSPKASPTLRTIHLDDTSIDTRAVQGIIGCARALTTLRIHWGTTWAMTWMDEDIYWDSSDYLSDVDPPALLSSLRKHQNSLVELSLHNQTGP